RTRGQGDADAPAREDVIDVVRIGVVERDRTPGAEPVPKRHDALEVRVDQGERLFTGERFDADRARQRDQRKLDAVSVEQPSTAGRSLRVEIDRARALARCMQLRDVTTDPDERQLAAGRERLDQWGGPDVLMY